MNRSADGGQRRKIKIFALESGRLKSVFFGGVFVGAIAQWPHYRSTGVIAGVSKHSDNMPFVG